MSIACREGGPELHGGKALYIFMSFDECAGQNRNSSLENVTEFKISERWCHEELHSCASKDSLS
jgi:hypothetical protein